MKTTRLVIGIIALIFGVILLFAANIINPYYSKAGNIFIVSILLISGGAFDIAARDKKWAEFDSAFYFISGLMSMFMGLFVWSVLSMLFFFMVIIPSLSKDKDTTKDKEQ